MYIIPISCLTILYCDCANDPTLRYQQLAFVRSFKFVWSIIIDHEFISEFIVKVDSFYVFADIIFTNFRLLSLPY